MEWRARHNDHALVKQPTHEVSECDERKAARSSRFAIDGQVHFNNGSVLGEVVHELILRDDVRKATNENLRAGWVGDGLHLRNPTPIMKHVLLSELLMQTCTTTTVKQGHTSVAGFVWLLC